MLKLRIEGRFSFSVRKKRSAQPLPSGARMKADKFWMPRTRSALWKV